MNIKAFLNTLSTKCRTLPVIILYVTEGCNLRCMTCSYRNPLPGELSLSEIQELAGLLADFGLRHIVYSGGEPLMRRDFPDICAAFARDRIQQTLLTNGLLLKKRLPEIEENLSEIIVSLDGPSAEIHDSIRGVESFERILGGIDAAVRLQPKKPVALRTVVQKRNFRSIPQIVRLGKSLNVSRVSFLAADVLSDSFGRAVSGPVAAREDITLTDEETAEFRRVVEEMRIDFSDDFRDGFVSESHEKLLRLVQYFEAINGKGAFPGTSCNAPMVSTVITSTGEVQPCFFLPAFSNIRDAGLKSLLNGAKIRSTRHDVYNLTPERCKTCVCTLYVPPLKALQGSF